MAKRWTEERLRQRLAKVVGDRRAELGWTLEETAEAGDLHWRLLQKIEAGEQSPTLRTLAKLSNAFGVEPSDLFLLA